MVARAAIRFSFEVGEKFATRVGCVSLTPPFTTSPGTFSSAALLAPVPPSARGWGPAEKPAAREPGGAGISVVFAGFSPTIASDASAVAPGTPSNTGGSAEINGAAKGFAGSVRGRYPRGTFSKPAFAALTPATSGAAGKPTAATGRDFAGCATKARGWGLGPAFANGSAFGSTTISGCGPSGSGSMACRCMRTLGGGVNARDGPLGATTGSGNTVCTSAAATRGASASGAVGGSAGDFTGGATNGRTTFAGAIATTLGSGTAFGVASSGSGAQISGAGRASSLSPAPIVCPSFTRARAARASACVSAGAISGSCSRKLYQTILVSFGRISRS